MVEILAVTFSRAAGRRIAGLAAVPLALAPLALSAWGQDAAPAPQVPNAYTLFSDARPTFAALYQDWPAELRGLDWPALEAAWPEWVRRRDREIRARLEQGDEDSVVNLWLYGTAFTKSARATEPETSQRAGGTSVEESIAGRLEDFLDAMTHPGENERLQFARDLFGRRGMDVATAEGRRAVRKALIAARQRVLDEHRAYERQIDSVQNSRDPSAALSLHATLYRERGLSSDTSILVGFAVEQALRGMIETGTFAPGSIRRVGVIGPGLDFTNKADGHDFYPQQSIQPFALIDSLTRVGLSGARGLEVVAFDVSRRVARHLERARTRAEAGGSYPLHLPISGVDRWRPDFLAFWNQSGDRIGEPAAPVKAPPADGAGRVRAVRVRPSVVTSIQPHDLNVVVERPSLAPDERFDLLVATNVLVYYDRFEQSLALANAAAMLRPGAVLLTNNAVFPISPFEASAHHLFVTYSDRQSEHVFWYKRR
jgi:hypothetical protein